MASMTSIATPTLGGLQMDAARCRRSGSSSSAAAPASAPRRAPSRHLPLTVARGTKETKDDKKKDKKSDGKKGAGNTSEFALAADGLNRTAKIGILGGGQLGRGPYTRCLFSAQRQLLSSISA